MYLNFHAFFPTRICGWPTVSSIALYFPAFVIQPRFLTVASYSIVWMCHNLANQSPVDGYLEGFQMFAIISNVAMGILLTSYIHAHISIS